MRKVILSVSGLALTACSMSGGGYADHNNHYSSQYAKTAYSSGYSGSYSGPQSCHKPAVYTPSCHVKAPVKPAPCPTVKPCQPVHYKPYLPPQPKPVVTPPCAPKAPCTTKHLRHSYGASPYQGGYSYPVAHTPSAHAYGSQVGNYHGGPAYKAKPKKSVWNAPHFYGSLGAVMYDIEDSQFGAQARAGYQFHPNLAAEVEGSVGLIDDSETVTFTDPNDNTVDYTGEADTGIDYSLGAFAVARMPFADRLSAHGRIGYHMSEAHTTLEDGAVKISVSDEFDGLAYGGGVEYKVSDTDSLRVDYTRYAADVGGLDSVSVGYLRRF